MALALDTSWLGWPQGETAGNGSGAPSKGCQTSSQGMRTAGFCFVPVANNFFVWQGHFLPRMDQEQAGGGGGGSPVQRLGLHLQCPLIAFCIEIAMIVCLIE